MASSKVEKRKSPKRHRPPLRTPERSKSRKQWIRACAQQLKRSPSPRMADMADDGDDRLSTGFKVAASSRGSSPTKHLLPISHDASPIKKWRGNRATRSTDLEDEFSLKSGARIQLSRDLLKSAPSLGSRARSAPLEQRLRHINFENKTAEDEGEKVSDEDYDRSSSPMGPSEVDEGEPMDADFEPDEANPLGSKFLEQDVRKLTQLASQATYVDWGNKAALMAWLAAGQQRISIDCDQGEPGNKLSGPGRRLEGIIKQCPERKTLIRDETWSRYLQQLHRWCSGSEIYNMGYGQRLMKIIDIIFLPEELDITATGDWDKLEKVVGFCSVLAEALGPEDEDLDEEVKNEWIAAKKMDVAQLKKILGSKNRVAALCM